MNRLQHETSPYLIQHARNPVDWYAWSKEAFDKAKKENKPILVSIGYSTCHWCHVMERESFEDHEIAEFMNDNFVCIKVDREERPDVDQIYMEACQVMTGGGGWPLNCFLLPDKRPFYAGTYYPPMPAYNRPSWLQVLMNISHAFQNKRATVEDQATRLTEIIQNAGSSFIGGNNLNILKEEPQFSEKPLHQFYQGFSRQFDTLNGGFGAAPKFPGTMALNFLLEYHFYFREERALQHVILSLDKMVMGGIYDQLGGGFARYSTDVKWLVPHFEKMLYDNALLVGLLSDAYKITKKQLYKEAIEETLGWVSREMTNAEGGFYSAQDADSEGEEGKYYVWEIDELEYLLGDDFELFSEFYGVTAEGNWEEKNIIWRKQIIEEFAISKGLEVDKVKLSLEKAKKSLMNARSKRVRPSLDDKVLLDWNALMCSAYAKAYTSLGEEAFKEMAIKNLRFVLEKFVQPDGISLYHSYKDGRAHCDGFLDDYAFLIEALLNVAEITADTSYILQARRYIEYVFDNFLDSEDKMFYFTSAKQDDILLRRKDFFDSATPSGNAVMVRNLQRASFLLGIETWAEHAMGMLTTLQDSIGRYPSSFAQWASCMFSRVFGVYEIAVVGSNYLGFLSEVNKAYLPHKVLMASLGEKNEFPLLEGKSGQGDTLVYLCQNYACQQPLATVESFLELINQLRRAND